MSPFFERILRRYIRSRLARSQPEDLHQLGRGKLMKAFRRAAGLSSAYRALLAEAGVNPDSIRTPEDFSAHCPILEKTNTFRRFGIDQLMAGDVPVDRLASVLTSSGHGAGGYAIGLSTRAQHKLTPAIIDMGLDLAFDTDRRKTLLINCLPMGSRSSPMLYASRTSACGKTWRVHSSIKPGRCSSRSYCAEIPCS